MTTATKIPTASEREVHIRLPQLLPWQREVWRNKQRFTVPVVGRQAGKTTLCRYVVGKGILKPKPYAWCEPTYKMMDQVWRETLHMLRPIVTRVQKDVRRIELVTGGSLDFWSLDNADAMRGRKYAGIVVDEAAQVPHLLDAWRMVLRPTLFAYKGWAWFPSTPNGLGDYFQLWQWAQDGGMPDWYGFAAPSHVNTTLSPDEIDDLSADKTSHEYRQEVLAEFLSAEGVVFRYVDEASTAKPQGPEDGHRYVMGVDLARTTDWTVATVLDCTDELRQVYVDRWQGIDWRIQLDRIWALVDRYEPILAMVDRTGIGDMPFAEMARKAGTRWTGVQFNNATKADMVQRLCLALERRELVLLDHAMQAGELKAYEASQKPSGLVTYNAPSGMHDDMVVALMLAVYGVGRRRVGKLVA